MERISENIYLIFAYINYYLFVAVFLAEEGMECVKSRKEILVNCVEENVPEIFQWRGKLERLDDLIVFNAENCNKGEKIRTCVENALLSCRDPTPSNVISR